MKIEMAKWKLTRQNFGSEEFTLAEGDEVTIGRAVENTICLSSLVVSRQHCILNVYREKVTIKDLKSSNGTYVGKDQITTNTPISLKDSDVIGFGWCDELSLGKVADNEKFVFKLVKEKSLVDRIEFQNDFELDEIERKIAAITEQNETFIKGQQSGAKLLQNFKSIKRKIHDEAVTNISSITCTAANNSSKVSNDVITLSSDSEYEVQSKRDECSNPKKLKLDSIKEEDIKQEVKSEANEFEFEAFNIKQEYLGYDDEPINLDSDSDSESESERRWFIRLSQSSPSKSLGLVADDKPLRGSSYSQQNDEEGYDDDLIKIPANTSKDQNLFVDDVDEVDNECVKGISSEYFAKQLEATTEVPLPVDQPFKKTQMIEPIAKASNLSKPKLQQLIENKDKCSPTKSSKQKKEKVSHSTKRSISNSQKEERKKKLKEIASKEKETSKENSTSGSSKREVNIKVTDSNRGAFLTAGTAESKQSKKESPKKDAKVTDKTIKESLRSRSKEEQNSSKPDVKGDCENNCSDGIKSIEPIKSNQSKSKKDDKHRNKEKHKQKSKSPAKKSISSKEAKTTLEKDSENIQGINEEKESKNTGNRIPLKNVKPLTDCDSSHPGKPFSKVEPLPAAEIKVTSLLRAKPKKNVRFSDAPPQVRVFEIEPGHQMKKTSLVKSTLLDVPQRPAFSLEKISLMRILRWNPHWLDEQVNNNDPPPILGHNNQPLSVLHYFKNHTQYVQVIGDLLLMEIWECLSQAHLRGQGPKAALTLSVESLPPEIPERSFELFNLSVNVSIPRTETKSVPRLGELMLITFGPETQRNVRFFYVHNVKCLPSPPKNVYSFYSVSLLTVYTEKMRSLRRGETMIGRPLAYIKNELSLFEAMECMARSPLSQLILRPDPSLFVIENNLAPQQIHSKWTETLNTNQLEAVAKTVSAALSDRPSIQLIQGPPGTGKSSVICSTIMTYFYDLSGRRRPNRGKVLVCATSNAAVDELVIRLLHIRQSLPKNERFRMVRVGRPESMHPRARDLSSQSLAQRDAQRLQQEPTAAGLEEEIGRQEARLNMWRTMASEAKDPARVAYCQSRMQLVANRIAQLRGGGNAGGNGGGNAGKLAAAERRIVEGADIVVTTLASAANNKMRGLRRRIALCIVDEAGQAVEPEALIPLTLEVTHFALIGDPQQLPGYICSQRAKKHGLGESLFARLSASMEHWGADSPVVLLNVQYRMHPAIADYPNRAFYGGKIRNAVTLRPELTLPPYCVVYISSGDKGQSAAGGNEVEAWGVARLAAALRSRARGLSLAVITPYNAHKELIRRNLRALLDDSAPAVEVNTVDSFQGQERDVVVVSLARSAGVGFLTDAGRMNVMLTRAKHSLLICLNPHAMVKNHQWRTLMDDAQARNLYKYLPNKACQPATASQASTEEILKYLL